MRTSLLFKYRKATAGVYRAATPLEADPKATGQEFPVAQYIEAHSQEQGERVYYNASLSKIIRTEPAHTEWVADQVKVGQAWVQLKLGKFPLVRLAAEEDIEALDALDRAILELKRERKELAHAAWERAKPLVKANVTPWVEEKEKEEPGGES